MQSLGGIATAVAAGPHHTCALLASGSMRCWGLNVRGELGDGTTTDRPSPVDVVSLGGRVTSVTTGLAHTCALLASGAVKCWGLNWFGQLGDKTTTNRSSPTDVLGLGAVVSWISAASDNTCAVLASGVIRCWGDNTGGQLGDGTHIAHDASIDVVSLGGHATSVSAGDGHTCATLDTGKVQCWGSNTEGQLGNESTKESALPVTVRWDG